MTKENLQYIVSVLKGETPKNCPDWWEMLGFLQCHKIAGMWYRKAMQLQLPLPDKIQRILQNIFDSQARRVRHMRGYIEELSDALCQTGVGHAFLKGSALCNVRLNGKEIYTDGERISNDIDILVAPDTLDAIGATLKALGYMQGRYDRTTDTVIPFARTEILRRRMNRGEVAPFVKRTDNAECPFAEIDVNFSLGNTPNDGAELLREMVRTAKAYDGKIKLNTLSPETFFLHLVMHQYKESCLHFTVERGKDLDVYKLADIFYLLKTGAVQMPLILEKASDFGVVDRLGTVLRQVGEIFEDEDSISVARLLGDEQPHVIDYAAKKEYVWQAGIAERLCVFDTTHYLQEV